MGKNTMMKTAIKVRELIWTIFSSWDHISLVPGFRSGPPIPVCITYIYIQDVAAQNPSLEKLLPLIKQNVGFVVTNGDLKEILDLIQSFKVPAMARTDAISPIEVPAQTTALGPEKTSFFQALSISTKITRGMIEITSKVPGRW